MSLDYGIKATKPAFNIDTADKNLSFTSDMKSIMVRSKGIASSASFNFAHGLGYRPAFDGYIVSSGKYFLNYFVAPLDGGSFEYTGTYGDIYTDTTNLHCEHGSANTLVYVCYVNPADSGASPTSIAAVGDFGIKISQGGYDVKSAKDGEMVLNSKFQSPLIILQDSITVNIDAIAAGGGDPDDVRKTNFTDYNHGRAQANHVIMPDFFGAGTYFTFSTEPTGLGPDYIIADAEVYIDATKIRVRVSRYAHSSIASISDPAQTFTVKFFLTNIALPT